VKIFHLSHDLMMNSQVSQIARSLNLELETIRDINAIRERGQFLNGVLIIDLQCPGWSAATFSPLAAEIVKSARVVAYAQHVRPELLAEAQSAGIDQVMTRGQFSRDVHSIIQNVAASSSSSSENAAPLPNRPTE
jgi:hypothetical protein